ncbi:bile acid:sodium symporter family protein [Mucilaginibacter sp. HMF5004]|uniref:bile acid:sodium symporter family protein n=1 Tax=Mucilaginibacter rivuli TaxID=2857527 RepID=UPI001C5FF44A|nr:bile acid:sodium symporter family protein [Mucilaginibacter rivuli]MBW4891821.1 bile acid:sodium symporter family protein [Mucilaginibacter rivuli]
MTKNTTPQLLYYIPAIILLIAYLTCLGLQISLAQGWLLMLTFMSLALAFRIQPKLKGFAFPLIIFGAVSFAMYYPQYFVSVGNFKLSKLIIPLLQVIMFGMGSELSLKELSAIFKSPKKVLVGVVCHYTVMPLIGFTLVSIFNFPKEIAAGIILVGCCPSGLASNVMSFLARANLALSIAVTTISTLLAPVFTPLLMRLLAGRLVPVDFSKMAWDTANVVIFPILAGLLFHMLLRGKVKWLDRIMPSISMIGIALIIVVITAAGRDSLLKVGLLLILAVFIHNTLGFTLGYWFSRLMRFPEADCRTISLEVGMQNSGLASGLALLMGGMATIGLAPAVFGPLMNITGSTLSTWWHGRVPVDEYANE